MLDNKFFEGGVMMSLINMSEQSDSLLLTNKHIVNVLNRDVPIKSLPSGTSNIDVKMQGKLSQPHIKGTYTQEEGSIAGIYFSNLKIPFSYKNSVFSITKSSAATLGGILAVSGNISLMLSD